MPISSRRRWALVAVVACGAFITALDQTVVVTALPSVMADLKVPIFRLESVIWVVTAYLLGYTVAMPVLGRLADVHGRHCRNTGKTVHATFPAVLLPQRTYPVARLPTISYPLSTACHTFSERCRVNHCALWTRMADSALPTGRNVVLGPRRASRGQPGPNGTYSR